MQTSYIKNKYIGGRGYKEVSKRPNTNRNTEDRPHRWPKQKLKTLEGYAMIVGRTSRWELQGRCLLEPTLFKLSNLIQRTFL